jgi:hypothetical protein
MKKVMNWPPTSSPAGPISRLTRGRRSTRAVPWRRPSRNLHKPVLVPHPVYIEKKVPYYIKKEEASGEVESADSYSSFGGGEEHY